MIELMKRGFVTHFATNGAGAIHDFEFSMIGQTCESVARYISEGQFGLWKETGYLNDAVDGWFGLHTLCAVAGFQVKSKLVADAIVGPATVDALKKV
jgi:uncharacterized protein (DUF779 family)